MTTPLSFSDPTDRYGSTMRVSDAERTAVADRLSQHYADGRLDKVEFEERLDRALNAKTRADLAGLLVGLPPGSGSPIAAAPAATAIQRRRPAHRAIFLVVLVVIAAIVGQAVVVPHIPWLLVALLVVLWLRHRGRSNIRR